VNSLAVDRCEIVRRSRSDLLTIMSDAAPDASAVDAASPPVDAASHEPAHVVDGAGEVTQHAAAAEAESAESEAHTPEAATPVPKPGAVTIEDENEENKQDDTPTPMAASTAAPVAASAPRPIDVASPSAGSSTATGATLESFPVSARQSTPTAASPSSASGRLGPNPHSVFLPVRLHAIHTTYIAKSNHFLQCDPIVVVAVDNRPMFKTSQEIGHACGA
jgi:hypothetical protein